MKGFLDTQFRTVVPRWRFFDAVPPGEVADLGLPALAHSTNPYEERKYEAAVRTFRLNPSVWYAGDLLPSAIARDDAATVRDLVTYILDSESASPILRDLALAQVEEPFPRASIAPAEVRALRRSLALYSRNAFGWLDLALHYTRLGIFERASRAIVTALQLAPNDRYVLRSASRFFIHRNDAERAHSILTDAPNTKRDPWLMAAEIAAATAAKTWPKLVKDARTSLTSGAFSSKQLSELASALGTIEWSEKSATRRHLRTLFRRSLEDPTENSIAQAQWLSLNDEPNGIVERELVPTSGSGEASAWKAFSEGAFERSAGFAKAWLEDQPFSSRPARLLSFVLESLLKDFQGAIDILRKALIPNRDDALLWNNLAFAYVNLSERGKAADSIRRAKSLSSDHITTDLAIRGTQGLLAFREGDSGAGRASYESVILECQRLGDKVDQRVLVMALAYLAREEARVGNFERGIELIGEAGRTARRIERPDATLIVEDVRRELAALRV